MTHKLTIKDKEYLLVEVPKDGNGFKISQWSDNSTTLEFFSDSFIMDYDSISIDIETEKETSEKEITLSLIKLDCKIINTISNLTEEECKELVECHETKPTDNEDDNYFMYNDYISGISNEFYTAKESFISLLESKNILAKLFVEEPTPTDFEMFDGTDKGASKFRIAAKEYQNLPDELLLIQINNKL